MISTETTTKPRRGSDSKDVTVFKKPSSFVGTFVHQRKCGTGTTDCVTDGTMQLYPKTADYKMVEFNLHADIYIKATGLFSRNVLLASRFHTPLRDSQRAGQRQQKRHRQRHIAAHRAGAHVAQRHRGRRVHYRADRAV